MTASPEVIGEAVKSTEELLRLHDPDPYGYIAHAAAALPKINFENDRTEGYIAIAEFASDVHDPQLMTSCIENVDEAAKWRIFAYEQQHGNYAMDLQTIQHMGETLVELESASESERDYIELSDIYTSQLEILLSVSPGQDLSIHLERLSRILSEVPVDDGNRYYAGILYERIVHALLMANRRDEAEPFSKMLMYDGHRKEYRDSKLMYERYFSGAPLTLAYKGDSTRYTLRRLAPREYIANCGYELAAGNSFTSVEDIFAYLQAGEPARAQRLYEGMLDYVLEFKPERIKMALWLASYAHGETAQDQAREVLGSMQGCRTLAYQYEQADGASNSDLMDVIARREDLEASIRSMCDQVDNMPYSSQRIALSLELASIQRSILPQSEKTKKYCDKLLRLVWKVAANTLSGRHTGWRPELVELRQQLKEEELI